jgi:hypothetical protein
MLVKHAREGEDLTRNKNDESDAVVIGRLVTELRCYLPERADPVWARLRILGVRRSDLVDRCTQHRLQIRALLESAWPAALGAAADPLASKSWEASMVVALDRVGVTGDLGVVRRLGWSRFAAAVRRELPNHGTKRWCKRIVRAVFDAATDPELAGMGVPEQRPGALEQVRWALAQVSHLTAELETTQTHMVGVLDDLGLTEVGTSIPGVSIVGVATILAETGDLNRFTSGRAVVKHAGVCPRDNTSGTFQGRSTISGRGRPELRLAAYRVATAAIRSNPVLAARYTQLTTREHNRLSPNQARIAVAGSLLRQLHAIITTNTKWDPEVASGRKTTTQKEDQPKAA